MSEDNQSDQNNRFSFESYQHIDSDYQLPKSTVTQLIQDNLPENVKMSSQTKDLIITLSMCYLNHLASCANNVCNQKEKKTILPEHVVDALQNLKMDAYIEKIVQGSRATPINEDFSKMSDKRKKALIVEKLQGTEQAQRKKFKKMNQHANDNGMTEEQLLEEQNRLFEQAKSFDYVNAQNDNNGGMYGDQQNIHMNANMQYGHHHHHHHQVMNNGQQLQNQPKEQDAVMIDTSSPNNQFAGNHQQMQGAAADQHHLDANNMGMQQAANMMVPSDQLDTIYEQIAESMERIRFTVDNTDFTTFDDQEDDELLPSVTAQAQQHKLPSSTNGQQPL